MSVKDRLLIDYESYIAEEDPGFALIGHDQNIRDISHILVQNEGHNVLLFGEPGVGRSAIMKGLTERKSSAEMPLDILGKRFKRLDVNGLFALGDDDAITESFTGIMAELQRGPGRVLVIDDFKDFLDNVDNMADTRVLNILMRHLKRGDFQCVSVFRKEHLSDVLNCHSDIKELFTKKEVTEPGKDEVLTIAKGKAKELEKHHQIAIDEAAVEEAVKLTLQYRGVQAFMHAQPSRTLRLLDLTASEVRLKAYAKPAQLDELEGELAKITGKIATLKDGEDSPTLQQNRAELEGLITTMRSEWEGTSAKMRSNYQQQRQIEEKLDEIEIKLAEERARIGGQDKNRAAEAAAVTPEPAPVSDTKSRLQSQFANLLGANQNDADFSALDESPKMAQLRTAKMDLTKTLDKLVGAFDEMKRATNADVRLTIEDVRAKFGELSGIPMTQLSVDEKQRMLKAESFLGERIIGQEEAIGAIASALRNAKAGLKDPNKPIGSFFFSGPSGVGKTETTKALAEFLFGDEKAMARLDMSEYMDKSNVSRLTGAAPGLVGFEEGGVLTNAVMRRPFSVVLFDEIEKANPAVLDVMLQILDDGRLTDNKGVVVDFRNTIVVATTNFGAHNFLDDEMSFDDAVATTRQQLYERGSPFRPEFLNRFTGLYFFKPLGLDVVSNIAKGQLSKINQRVAENGKDFRLEMSDSELGEFCEAKYVKKYGARVINNAIANEIGAKLAEIILANEDKGGGVIKVSFSPEGGVSFATEDDDKAAVAPVAAGPKASFG